MERRHCHDDVEDDLSRLLPDDVLAAVLRLAAPRTLAVSRSVCRAWRSLIDDRRLLRTDHLPHSLAGIFIDYSNLPFSEFFARPASSTTSANYHGLDCITVADHCNGLVLTNDDGVLNPATGGWTPLPEAPPPCTPGTERFPDEMYLAFNPTLSPRYEVLAVPTVPLWFGERRRRNNELVGSAAMEEDDEEEEYPGSAEWPPSPYRLSLFSSRTRQWDERSFVREGEGAGTTTAAEVAKRPFWGVGKPMAVCWRGALYVHCQMDFIMRISLSDDTYRLIRPPRDLDTSSYTVIQLGQSEKGVYSASLQDEDLRLRVWLLDESGGQTKWILKHDSGRGLAIPALNLKQQAYGPWMLQSDKGGSNEEAQDSFQKNEEAQVIEWNSDDDDSESIIQTDQDGTREHPYVSIGILGFHPFREIVFLHRSWSRGLAYHLNSSKLEDLGDLCPKDDTLLFQEIGYIRGVFPYTPCLMGEFSGKFELSDDD